MSGEMMPHTLEGQAFLGAMAETENAKKVEWVANNMVNVLHFRPSNDEDRKKILNYSSEMINELGFKVDTVKNLKLVEDDDRKTPGQKEIARENLEILAKGTFLAMQKGMDIEMMDLLGQGSAVEIDKMLPDPLKGLGKEVVKNVITNPSILKGLKKLDDIRQNYDLNNSRDKALFLSKIEKVYDEVTEIEGLNEEERKQLHMVKAYLNTKMQTLDDGVSEKGGKKGELEAIASLLSSERAESTYETFVTAEFLQQPIQLQVDTFPPSWFRNKPDNFHGTISDWQQVIRARINITNASYIKAEVAALDGEKAKDNSYLKLSEKELKIIYEMEGVRDTMQNVVQDFFKIERDSKSNAEFLVLKKESVNGKPWKEVLANFRDYQESLATRLIKDKEMSENDARGAVAASWNFLYISNIFESADKNRDIGGECANIFGEQIRAMMHPLSKAKAKFIKGEQDERSQGTEEGWGGNVGAWFADMFTWSDTRSRFAEQLKNGEIKPFPDRIGASMVDMMNVKTEDGPEMSLAQALLLDKKVSFNRADSNLFGEYGDKWDTFFKYYYYSTGKNLIQFGKNLDEWSNGLADVLAKIRSIKVPGTDPKIQMFQELDSSEAFGWIMLNSIGIVRSPDLMLSIPDGLTYETVVDVILRQPRLVPEKAQRKEIKHMLNGEFLNVRKRLQIKWDATSRSSKAPR